MLDVDIVTGVGGGVGCVAVNCEGSSSRWDGDLLGVCSSQDEDALSCCRCGAQRVDGSLNLRLSVLRFEIGSRLLTVEYVPPEPTVMAPEGADVRLAARAADTNELIESRRRIM